MTSYYLNNVVFGFARSYRRRWSSSYVVMRLTIVILLYVCGGLGKGPKLCNVHCTVPFQACHTRIFPAQKYPPPGQFWVPKMVPLDHLWFPKNDPPLPTVVLAGQIWQPKLVRWTIFGSQSCPPDKLPWMVLLPYSLFLTSLSTAQFSIAPCFYSWSDQKWESLWIWLIVKQEHDVR